MKKLFLMFYAVMAIMANSIVLADTDASQSIVKPNNTLSPFSLNTQGEEVKKAPDLQKIVGKNATGEPQTTVIDDGRLKTVEASSS